MNSLSTHSRGGASASAPLAGRRFLLVTMPFGPFARRFARALAERGAEARRVIMNGGDRLDWGVGDAFVFRGPFPAWADWLAHTAEAWGATDLVIFGDSISYAADAVDLARRTGRGLWVLENGYFRPHWVTLEPGGVNGASTLPRDPAVYRRSASLETPPPHVPVGRVTPRHMWNIIRHHLAVLVSLPFSPGYRYPFALEPWAQVRGHVRRYAFSLVDRGRRAARAQEALLSTPGRFFLLCLQREGDSQLVRHSPLKSNREVLAHVLDSFAAHAPAGTRLVVKNHPLDPGVEDLEQLTRELAAGRGLGDRVVFVDGGSLAALSRVSDGLVTVNSTAALAVLGFGRPVKLLGDAFFDLPELTDQQPLHGFWTRPQAPDPDLYQMFRRYVVVHTQVNGNFHGPQVLDLTCANLVRRIVEAAEAAAGRPRLRAAG